MAHGRPARVATLALDDRDKMQQSALGINWLKIKSCKVLTSIEHMLPYICSYEYKCTSACSCEHINRRAVYQLIFFKGGNFMATFHLGRWTSTEGNVNTVLDVRWYEMPIHNLEIRRLTRTNVQLDRPGVNASFFGSVMTSIHWFNGQRVHTGGETNLAQSNVPGSGMSCLFLPNASSNVSLQLVAANINAIPASAAPHGIRWAIGGFSLLLDENHTTLQSIRNRYATIYAGITDRERYIPNLSTRRARTFIGVNPSRNILCVGVMSTIINPAQPGTIFDSSDNGATYFDMHNILRNRLNCTMGLSIDGGGSSRIRRITPASGNNMAIQYSASSSPNRNVLCQLSFLGAQPN